jgi:nitrite reductase/ring-hydroxylating ferredoxin subunit
MKEFDLGDGKVLVVREGSEFHALGPKCTHYGAPLVNGSHCNGRIRCPWHGACFSVKTGDIEDFPGLDSIPKFKVNQTHVDFIVFYIYVVFYMGLHGRVVKTSVSYHKASHLQWVRILGF